MKEIPLSKGFVALVDDDKYEELIKRKWHVTTSQYGKKYARGYINCVGIYMHRYLLTPPSGYQIDHIDGNGLNNQMSNFRFATPSENSHNKSMSSNNTSGYKGVFKDDRGQPSIWVAKIHLERSSIFLGYFQTAEQAARAYDAKARELFGEFALVNFGDEDVKSISMDVYTTNTNLPKFKRVIDGYNVGAKARDILVSTSFSTYYRKTALRLYNIGWLSTLEQDSFPWKYTLSPAGEAVRRLLREEG